MTDAPGSWEGYTPICIKELLLSRGMVNDCLCFACHPREKVNPILPEPEKVEECKDS